MLGQAMQVMSMSKAVPKGLKNQGYENGNRKTSPPIPYVPLGCDFFSSQTKKSQIHERTVRNICFRMVTFVCERVLPCFCCHADRRCADTHLRAMKKHISLVSTVLIYLLYLTKDFAKRTSPWWSRSPDPIACWLCYFLLPPRWNLFMIDWSRSLSKNFIQLCKTAKKKIN